LKHPAFHHYIKPFASGTTVKHLRVDGLLDYPIFLPDEKIRDVFADVMEPIRRKIADNSSQCVELSKMRDYLLPLLMNGQVSVKSSGRSK
jgi:type I restriction enzyme S subunit